MSAAREEAIRLREQKYWSVARIAAHLGVACSTVYYWLNPELAGRQRRSSREAKRRRRPELAEYNKRYSEDHRERCVGCGLRRLYRQARGDLCRACIVARKEARWQQIQAMWANGQSILQIANALGISKGHLGVEMVAIRRAGWDLPYRYHVQRKVAA